MVTINNDFEIVLREEEYDNLEKASLEVKSVNVSDKVNSNDL